MGPASDRDVLLAFVSKIESEPSLKTAQIIPSLDNKTEVLLAVIRLDGLDSDFLATLADFAGKNIHSSDDRERVLKEVINYR